MGILGVRGWVLLHSLWASVYTASLIALLASGYKEDCSEGGRMHVRHCQLWSLILFLPESPCREGFTVLCFGVRRHEAQRAHSFSELAC